MANEALLAAMKLRQQQKADEDARAHAEEMARQNVTDQSMPIWPTLGEGAMKSAQNYATGVYNAAAPQVERAVSGGGKALLGLFGFGGDEETGTDPMQGAAGANAAMDLGYGALNTAFSPLAPPIEATLKPALESESGQQFVQGLDALGTDIEDLTGISKQNQLDTAMWGLAPIAGHYVAKPFKGMAQKIIDADAAGAFGGGTPKPQGIPEIALPDFEARDYSIPEKSPEVAALEEELNAGRWFDQRETQKRGKTPNRLREADPTLDAPDEIATDALGTMQKTIREGMGAEPWWMQPTETRVAAPEMRAINSMDETFANFDANPTGFDESGMPKTGADLAKSYRDWAQREGATIDDALSALENEKAAWPASLYNDAVATLTKEAEANAAIGVPGYDARGERMSPEAIADQYRQWAKEQGGTIDDAVGALWNEESAWPKGVFKEVATILEREAAPEFYDQSKTPLYNRISAEQKAKTRQSAEPRGEAQELQARIADPAIDKPDQAAANAFDDMRRRMEGVSPLAELDGAAPRDIPGPTGRRGFSGMPVRPGEVISRKGEQRGPIQELQALTSDGPKKPASVGVKVKPGQSLWDVVSGKTFQAGDDVLRNKPRSQIEAEAADAAMQAKIDAYAKAQNPLKDVDIDQLVPTEKAKPGATVPRRVTVMPEGKADGKRTGSKNVQIVTSPDLRDFAKAAKGNVYDEARFLVEEDGTIHTWPAEAGWHNDIATFLGIDGADNYHGVLRKAELDAAIKNGAKTMQDVVEFTQQPAWWGPHKQTYGLDKLPEWQAAEKALADSYAPKGAPPTKFNTPEAADNRGKWFEEQRAAQSPLEELDNTPLAPEQPKSNVQKWMTSREDAAKAYLDDQRNAKMPRKKGEKLVEARGYTELQAKRSPVEEFDNPDPRAGEIAAARARADELFSYKKEQPAATKPEVVPEIKAETRRIWLDPERPVLQPKKGSDTISMLANKDSGRGKFEASLKEATAKVGKDFAKERENAFTANTDDHITTSSLAAKTNKALEEHIAMTPEQRMVNFAAAEKKLRAQKWEIETRKGKKIKAGLASKKGGVYNFFTANKKLKKNSEGYEGGEPITLPNGQGVESTGLSLSAFYQRKGFNTCPRGQPCKDACLAETSGGNMRYDSPAVFQETKTNAILDYPEASSVVMFENIAAAREIAARRGNVLTVRMNVLSDIDPKVWAPIIKHFDDVLFIDYTKMKYEPIAPNHHYTYSSTGASNANITSIYANWDQSKARLDRGDNVAMAFSTKKTWPKWVVDEETGKRYRVVDGVSHDFRVVDLQDGGKEGVIVGLKNMDETSRDMSFNKTGRDGKSPMSWEDDASTTSGGFMVRYNPAKDGDTAYIPIQNSAKRSRLERNKTGPQTQIKIGGEDRTPAENLKALTLEDVLPERTKAEKKADKEAGRDIAERMYARLNMFDHAPKMDKNQPRKLFEDEYPDWQGEDRGQRLETDIDGQPINPDAMIVGRREKGGIDKGHSPRAYRAMAERLMKEANPNAKGVYRTHGPKTNESGSFGYSKGSQSGKVYPERIKINSAREPWEQDQTLAHEIGHLIDFMASNAADKYFKHVDARTGKQVTKLDTGGIHVREMMKDVEYELRDLYAEANEAFGIYRDEMKGLPKSPERTGYRSHLAPSELIAEAFRVYMYDPGYIKARYPKAAKFLRDIVRENPEVSKHVHFNELGSGLAGVMATKMLADQQQGDR